MSLGGYHIINCPSITDYIHRHRLSNCTIIYILPVLEGCGPLGVAMLTAVSGVVGVAVLMAFVGVVGVAVVTEVVRVVGVAMLTAVAGAIQL